MSAGPGTGTARLRLAGGVLGIAVAALGALVLMGWAFGIPALWSLRSDWATMKFNSALGFLACGSALALACAAEVLPARKRSIRLAAAGLALAAFLIGTLTLLEYLFEWELGIDELVVADPSTLAGQGAPGRPSVPTSTSLAVSGVALFLIARKPRVPANGFQLPALAVFGISLFVVVRYVYGISAFRGTTILDGVAVHTALGLLALAAGILLARPDEGLMRVLTSPHAGGYFARRLTPVFLTLPFVIGWFRLQGELAGLYDLPFGLALNVVGIVAVLSVCVWWSAASLNRVDAELKRQTVIFDSVMNSVAEGVVVADPAGKFLLFNPAAERIVGLGATDAPPPEWSSKYGVYKPDGVTPFPSDESPLVRAIQGVSTDDVEQFLRNPSRPGGVSVTVSGRPLLARDGTRIGGVVVVHDVTERKHAEEKFRLVLSAAPVGMIMVDPEGRIGLVNDQAERVFGYSRQELVGRPVEDLIPARFRAGHPELRARYSQGPKTGAMGPGRKLFGLRKDGSEFPVEIRLSPLKTPNGTFVLSAIDDITERRKAEERIEALNEDLARNVAELKTVNGELETFSYSVSHDLRAPLRAVMGFGNVLIEDQGPALGEAGKETVTRIIAAAKRMGTLIDGLLDLSRLTRKQLASVPVDLSQIGLEVAGELRRSNPDRDTTVEVAPEMTTRGDPNLLRVAVSNLLGNAWKYTSKRGQARIEFGASNADGGMTYYVRDNGAGFDMRYADKLFGAFQRLHATSEFEGSGIGLATVQRIVHRHGGRIWAEAEVDKGATFYFTL